ncbi:hypothetical protein [Streptomyces sp. NRRL S-350]|uniref:hypothetical protein n=1 Tax=Streptomyces sp. NRRL S-350 TaxID=1463902 RepID=UPI0004BEECC9|nr:hypothetical protein [Streptomyces sp. NRRL S-350]
MPVSRTLLAAALVASAAFGLTACGPDDSSDQGAGSGSNNPATAAPTAAPTSAPAAPTGSPAGTGKPAPTGASTPSGQSEEGFCTHGPLPAGQKWIYPGKGTTTTTLVYKDTKDVCGVDDVGFDPVGADKTAAFAPTAKGHLSSVLAPPKDVNLADLVKHVNECIATPHNEKGSYPCSSGDYKVAIDASGKVTELWERAHS